MGACDGRTQGAPIAALSGRLRTPQRACPARSGGPCSFRWSFYDAVRALELGAVVVRQEPLRDLFHRHREVVLRAGLHKRRRIVVEGALTELMVVVVDLAGALGRDDDERVARVNVGEQ